VDETGQHSSCGEMRSVAVAYGRSMLAFQSMCGRCARFSFSDLCCVPLSGDDFAALCQQFYLLIVTDVPRMRVGDHTEAQRWIWLLDQCYERHTQLVITSSAAGLEDLVDLRSAAMVGAGGGRSLAEVTFAAARATSRMHEMSTKAFQDACTRKRVTFL
jgi:predicted ATPase